VALPPGTNSIVPGGREVGEYLVSHPGVDKVTFTGSTAADTIPILDLSRPRAKEIGWRAISRPVSMPAPGSR
jgi:delta 1-pyrroline-5-carboxylate dehydrogenase